MEILDDKKKNKPERWVKFDFENAPASALEEITRLQEGSTVLTPSEAGKTYSAFVVGWSFEGKDFKKPRRLWHAHGRRICVRHEAVPKFFSHFFRRRNLGLPKRMKG